MADKGWSNKSFLTTWGDRRKAWRQLHDKKAGLWSLFTWRQGGHTGVPKQLSGGHVGVPSKSYGIWTNFLSPVRRGETLLDVTCCVRLHTLLRVVGICWEKFESGQTLQQTTPNISLFPWSPKRSAQQCWVVCTTLSTLLGPLTRITHGLQSRMCCILPTMHCKFQHDW